MSEPSPRTSLPLGVGVPLAPHTTLELGGPAQHFVRAADRASVLEALRWARSQTLPVTVLGGGSNVVINDAGVPGLVLQIDTRGVGITRRGHDITLTVEAGEDWDTLVARSVDEGWAGLECLSGIPGRTGATPIQNVGAYGQEVSQTLRAVELLDRDTLQISVRDAADCGFGYRTSAFKTEPDRLIVLSVSFGLRAGGPPTLRYPELINALGPAPNPDLARVRQAVLALRRNKSMLIDPDDDNRRSAGSFFLNPVLDPTEYAALCERAVAEGAIARREELPTYPAANGGSKIPAAWLIEHAGFGKGTRRGPVGISSRHSLALVHHGGGTTQALLALAREIRDRVIQRFGVRLHPEPVFIGFAQPPLD